MDLHSASSNEASSSHGQVHHSIAIPGPERLTKCVSMVEPPSGTGNQNTTSSSSSSHPEDDAVIAAPVPTVTHNESIIQDAPAQIPLEEATTVTTKNHNDNDNEAESNVNVASVPPNDSNNNEDEESDWGDEDSYEYEDDDDVAFSGFLAPPPAAIACSTAGLNAVSTNTATSGAEPARILDEDPLVSPTASAATKPSSLKDQEVVDADSRATSPLSNPATTAPTKRKWKEPTRAAVSMSLRAQSETTGGKRRLAQDLYRIMNQDTEEAGFSLQPQSEDSMDKWTIKLFKFDEDSNLAKDMKVVNTDHIELEMGFPDQYPFEPPFVRVVRPRFKKQTGFVMNGALCMELLTKDGWNPINDIESVIVSVRSLLVVGDGRLHAAANMSSSRYTALLEAATGKAEGGQKEAATEEQSDEEGAPACKKTKVEETSAKAVSKAEAGSYSAYEAQSAYSHLSDYHKKKGWDNSGWWARKG